MPVTVRPIVDIDESHARMERANSMNFSGVQQDDDDFASIIEEIRKEKDQKISSSLLQRGPIQFEDQQSFVNSSFAGGLENSIDIPEFDESPGLMRNQRTAEDEERQKKKEFFNMVLLSYQLNNKDCEEVMKLDSKALYQKCVEVDKTQFHKFPEWIAQEIHQISFKKHYFMNKQKLEVERDLLKDIEGGRNGKKLAEFSIRDDYFKI